MKKALKTMYLAKAVTWLGKALQLRRDGLFVAAGVAEDMARVYVDRAERMRG